MKYSVLFLFAILHFFGSAQKSPSANKTPSIQPLTSSLETTSINASSESISSSSVISTVINLNPVTGSKFFAVETSNKDYFILYSYEDFKKQFQDLNAKGDEKYVQEFIFKSLDIRFISGVLNLGE